MADSEHFHNLKRGGIPRQLADGLSARVFPGEHLMLSVVEIAPGSVSPVHAHPNEQWGVCLEGEWVRVQDGVEHHVKAGDFWQTPPNVPHGGRALQDKRAVVLDIFSPPREEYKKAGVRVQVRIRAYHPARLTTSPGGHHNRARAMMSPSLYLVTGGAGFIGSHVAERLLDEGHRVRVLDNFSTGNRANLAFAMGNRRLEILRGDLKNLATVQRAVRGVTAVFHQAAMRSVPRSVADPLGANASNVTGTLHVLVAAARQKKKPRVVYASSSSVYGERPDLPKREEQPVAPISPYAASKAAGELYASVWSRLFGVETVGLRYFNVFGPRQDPKSEYAAVIPRFIRWGSHGQPLQVHGDGTQSRDFTYIENVVSANLLAAAAPSAAVSGRSYNVGCGSRTSLIEIIGLLERLLGRALQTRHRPTRVGDVPHTLADISAAKRDMGYEPLVDFPEGLRRTVDYFTEGTR